MALSFLSLRKALFAIGFLLCSLGKSHGVIVDSRGRPSETLLQIFREFSPLFRASDVLSKIEIEAILSPETPAKNISLKSLNLLAQAVLKRPDDLERSQLPHSAFNQQFLPFDTPRLRSLFKKIGDIDAVYPSQKPFRYILLNGATVPTMRQRLKTLIDMVQAEKLTLTPQVRLVFLTGDRDLFEDETASVLLNPKPLMQNPYWTPPFERSQFPKTEFEAAQWLWTQTDLPPALRKAPIVFVNAPKKNGKRPDTLGTVVAWIGENPIPGHCLSISSQPFVFYQELVIRQALERAAKGFTVEGIGDRAEDDVLLSLLADNLARTLFAMLAGRQPPQK